MCKDLLCNKALYVQGRVCRKLYRSVFLTLCIEFHYKHRKVLYIEEQFRTKIEEGQNAQISGLASNSPALSGRCGLTGSGFSSLSRGGVES